jgi:hypothetical protein
LAKFATDTAETGPRRLASTGTTSDDIKKPNTKKVKASTATSVPLGGVKRKIEDKTSQESPASISPLANTIGTVTTDESKGEVKVVPPLNNINSDPAGEVRIPVIVSKAVEGVGKGHVEVLPPETSGKGPLTRSQTKKAELEKEQSRKVAERALSRQ